MGVFEFRAATQADIDQILSTARQENIDELQLVEGLDLGTALSQSVERSEESYVAVHEGVPVCAFGVVTTPHPGTGVPWMVGTSNIDKCSTTFLRYSKAVINELNTRWPLLMNYADARNKRGLRWLKFMGFTIHEAEPLGDNRLMFHRFERRA